MKKEKIIEEEQVKEVPKLSTRKKNALFGIASIVAVVVLIACMFMADYGTSNDTNDTTSDGVTVYVFHRSSCPYCQNLIAFLEEIKDEYPDVSFITYEIYDNSDNRALWQDVVDALGLESVTSVPFLVIGDYSKVGFSSSSEDTIREAIEDALEDEDYKDYVAEVIAENPDTEYVSEEL